MLTPACQSFSSIILSWRFDGVLKRYQAGRVTVERRRKGTGQSLVCLLGISCQKLNRLINPLGGGVVCLTRICDIIHK